MEALNLFFERLRRLRERHRWLVGERNLLLDEKIPLPPRERVRRVRRGYGWKRSPEDKGDFLADPSGLTIQSEVDLRKGPMPLVFDQGQLGSWSRTWRATCGPS
jgi:hypothetical protein